MTVLSTRCHFCGARAESSSALRVPMFRLQSVSGSNQGVARSTRMEYESAVHLVPRCPACRRLHAVETVGKRALGWVFALALVVVVLAGRSAGAGGTLAALAVALGFLGLLFVAGMLVLRATGARGKRRLFGRRTEWPPVHAAFAGGWQFGEQPSMSEGKAWANERRAREQDAIAGGRRAARDSAKAEKLYFRRNVKGLLRMAQSGRDASRSPAIAMLGMVDDPAALEYLLRLLQDPAHARLRGETAQALVRYQDPRVEPAIRAVLEAMPVSIDSSIPSARADMLRALQFRNDPDRLAPRPKKVERHPDRRAPRPKKKVKRTYERNSQAYLLYSQGDIPGLQGMALDRNDAGRARAIDLLGDALDPSALELLLSLVVDLSEPAVRGEVAWALEHYDDPRIDPALRAALELPAGDPMVKRDLANVLARRAQPSPFVGWEPLSRADARKRAQNGAW